ncbi:MAG: disulfide oxidoreductase, partial [Proteobacteria bacterium]|nr:disulfide oxidoreductase [Pseudomonadota bacterium]
ALSPRTRNAQVAMYQDGEVDYLVATDAIGMGLNMDVGHVAFAAKAKFDGRKHRPLTAAELAQTAGRAGRHMNDGTFGTTGAHGPLDPDLVARIENHHFEPLKFLCWRNPNLDFSSLDALARSLAQPPRTPGLIKARPADDELVLGHLAREPAVAALATTPDGVRRLWDVCRIPDFGKVMSDAHARLLGTIYGHLMGDEGRIPTDWMAAQVARLERTDGDIETLAGRIASVRTWTYVAYHSDWLDDAGHWQERTRGIEDKLSDALHLSLTQRFVDKRTSILLSRIKQREDLLAAVDGHGDVTVEGHFMGRLEGFRFIPDDDASLNDDNLDGAARKTVSNAAQRALRGEMAARLRRLEADGDDMFQLTADDSGWRRRVLWRGEDVARITAGPGLLKPVVAPLAGGLLETPARDRLRRRLQAWLDGRVRETLAPLFEAPGAEVKGPLRGLLFQLSEGLGSLGRDAVGDLIGALGRADRKVLRQLGVRIGRHGVFMPALLKPGAVAMRGLLWVLHRETGSPPGAAPPPPPPLAPGRVSTDVIPEAPEGFYEAQGYVRFGALAVRHDMVERLASKAWALARKGPFTATPELLSLAGCGADEMTAILRGLGYPAKADKDGVVRFRDGDRGKAKVKAKAKPKPKPKPKTPAKKSKTIGDSPFAKLRDLTVAQGR